MDGNLIAMKIKVFQAKNLLDFIFIDSRLNAVRGEIKRNHWEKLYSNSEKI